MEGKVWPVGTFPMLSPEAKAWQGVSTNREEVSSDWPDRESGSQRVFPRGDALSVYHAQLRACDTQVYILNKG